MRILYAAGKKLNHEEFENSIVDTPAIKVPSKSKSFSWLTISLVITGIMVFMVNKDGSAIPQKVEFTITSLSHDVNILRNSKDLSNVIGETLQNLDVIDVKPKGELCLSSSSNDNIFIAGGSQILMQKKSTEAFQLLKGSLSADLSESQSTLSFITRDLEVVAEKARFIVSIKKNHTKVCVMKGSVKLTRLKDGESITLTENQASISEEFSVEPLSPEDLHMFQKFDNRLNSN